jgi:hypothetical protein
MKSRQIEVGRQRFRIAPLTFSQAEEACTEAPGRESCLRAIAHAIANAGGPQYTPAELSGVLNLHSYRVLHDAVLEVSGLKAKPSQDGQQQKPTDFGELRCFLVAATQWTVDECDRTPFPFVLDYLDYCQEFPPVHLLVRGFVGYKPPLRFHRRDSDGSSEEDKRLLVGMWGGDVRPMAHLPPQLQLALARLPAELENERKTPIQ